MILSFHPCFVGDQNIICAGRNPDSNDLDAIRAADAVILPQGCKQPLYDMARNHCNCVFPNDDARFAYPGKTGQIHLFRNTNTLHPVSLPCHSIQELETWQSQHSRALPFPFPFVFKFDWGGEGENVMLVQSMEQFSGILDKAAKFEASGQKGFLLQEYIPSMNRSLRIAVMGTRFISYWRIQENDIFWANLSKGARIDFDLLPDLQEKAKAAVSEFCNKTRINLAGIDILFHEAQHDPKPLFLEINYFFGRQGIGGSEAYYTILHEEILKWLAGLGLNLQSTS